MPPHGCPEKGARHPARGGDRRSPQASPPPTATPAGPAPPSGVSRPLRTPASPPRLSRRPGASAAAARASPDGSAAGNRGLLRGPHRPAPAHVGAPSAAPSPGRRRPRSAWPRPPGAATAPAVQDWRIGRNPILRVPGPRAPPCLFVTLRPCHPPRERSLRGPRPAGVDGPGAGGEGVSCRNRASPLPERPYTSEGLSRSPGPA